MKKTLLCATIASGLALPAFGSERFAYCYKIDRDWQGYTEWVYFSDVFSFDDSTNGTLYGIEAAFGAFASAEYDTSGAGTCYSSADQRTAEKELNDAKASVPQSKRIKTGWKW